MGSLIKGDHYAGNEPSGDYYCFLALSVGINEMKRLSRMNAQKNVIASLSLGMDGYKAQG